MSERSRFEIYKKKLQGICDENNLVFRFRNDIYPITLTIKPANDFDAQLSMIENAEENGFTSPDAYIAFAYKDGDIDFHISDSFTISDVLFSKIKNLYKKMHSLWLQFFFREIIQNEVLKSRNLPKIEDDDEDEQDIDDDGEPMDGDDDLDADELDTGDLENDLDNEDGDDGAQDSPENGTVDVLFDEACRIVREDGKASTARLQHHFHIDCRQEHAAPKMHHADFKAIKHMNQATMEHYLYHVYSLGFDNGVKAAIAELSKTESDEVNNEKHTH